MDVFNLNENRYKANLHTHSKVSDGQFTPEEVIALYKRKGYDAIALTDHRKTNKVSALPVSGMTIISGIELHPKWKENDFHFLALNVPEDFKDTSNLPYQDCVDSVVAAGGLCFLAHPYWTGQNVSDILEIKNLSGMEVFNTSTRYIGKQFNMVHWDGLLDNGWRVPAIAVDDMHSPCDLFQGWTVLCAKDKSPASLMDALEKGCAYSSMGPEFHSFDVDFEARRIKAEFSPAVEVILLSSKSSGICLNVPGGNASLENGKLANAATPCNMDSFSAEIPAGIKYVRCQIKDKKGRYAWTNPVYFNP